MDNNSHSFGVPHNASIKQVEECITSCIRCLAIGHGSDDYILNAMHYLRLAQQQTKMAAKLSKNRTREKQLTDAS